MKLINNISKIGLLATCFGLLMLTSCKDDLPGAFDSSANMTVLKTIKIVNGGANGNTVLEGVVDEDKKTVSFPRIEPETDFSNLRFDAELSNGAKLDKESYVVTFEEGQSEKVITVKAVNQPRYREYLVTLRLKVPVFGADFAKEKVYDYTPNPLGNPIYPDFTGTLTRGSGFDGEHVLIVTRAAGGSHLLKASDLRNNIIAPIKLNETGVVTATLKVNTGDIINGHTYIANLSNPLKIYHWTDPSAAPEIIADITFSTVPGASARYGDNMSVNLDKDGNGYIYLGDNVGSQTTNFMRLKVTNYTTVTDPVVFPTPTAGPGSFVSYNRVGTTSEYLFTGHDASVAVVDDFGMKSYTMSRLITPVRGQDARVIFFNGERYLMMTAGARTGTETPVLFIYDINKGGTIADALGIFENSVDRKEIFSYPLMAGPNSAPTTRTSYIVNKDASGKDESLTIYTATTDAGFVIIDIPKKQAED